jgi:DNA-binding HxlR family transcriptional regulator
MRNYGQFCPIARGSEILAERWTPIILRNILQGCRTFNEIAAGAPGLSRALLTRRLRELEHAGVIQIRPKPDGHGSLYEPTPAGWDLQGVLNAIGGWAERLLAPEPVAVGSPVERVAGFLGRRVHYVNEVTELTGDRLVMRSVQSPFPMRVTYGHRQASDGATEVSVRVEGNAGRFYALTAPLLGPAVRRSIARDLRNLKRVLEGRPRPSGR